MSFQIQHKIKQNAQELNSYVSDLYSWQKQMETKEKIKEKIRKEQRVKNDEISKAKQLQTKLKLQQEQKKRQQQAHIKKMDLIRDVNTVGNYYKAWDQFDADKQLERLEQQQKRAYKPYNPYEDSKNNLRAKPKTKITINSRRNVVSDPTELKDRGNLHFKSMEFDKAINCYSQCLAKVKEENISIEEMNGQKKKLICVVLSNRSMTYLKLREISKALDDANESIKYDPKYSKSYYRRAECYKLLRKYKESLKDFKKVKQLQPNEPKVDAQIKSIEAYFSKKAKETRQSLILQYNPNMMLGGRKIQIQQVQQLQAEQQKKQINYLQQL